jgi:two-component system copper resistance phosphate regulon response regulator CusR
LAAGGPSSAWTQSARSAAGRPHGFALDCIRRKVTRSGENIELAPKEFSILEYLMRNRGRPLSRTMIVEHVWDMDYDGLTNIVDVYIPHLRSKNDDKWPQKMIQTVRGIGYMLDLPDKTMDRAG